MAVLQIADYKLLLDRGIMLDAGEEQSFSFTLPADCLAADWMGEHKPILCYKLDTMRDSRLLVQFQDVNVLEHFYGDGASRGVWEALDVPNLASLPTPYVITLKCLSGKMQLSDIVFWYKRRIEV